MSIGGTLDRMCGARGAWALPVLLALAASVAFCVLVYPTARQDYAAVLDSDHYGDLGYGIWWNHSLSYYPDPEPTVDRGPVYPAFLAAALAATDGWYPWSIQFAQCGLFAATALLIFYIGTSLFSRRVGLLAAVVCAVHPFCIWYTGRIWIESVAMFLFAAVVAATLAAMTRPSVFRAAVAGVVVGTALLCKETFLPLAIFVALVLWALPARSRALDQPRRGRCWPAALAMLTAAVLTIAPWTVRNWRLTGRLIPVHLLTGVNCQIGDGMAEHYASSPWSFADLWDAGAPRREALSQKVPPHLPRWKREVRTNEVFLADSFKHYLDSPTLLPRKVALNSYLFWILGQNATKTGVIAAMQVPLVVLFGISGWRTLRRRGWRSGAGAGVVMIVLYYLCHLPVVAAARYSVVLVPVMVVYAVGLFSGPPSALAATESAE